MSSTLDDLALMTPCPACKAAAGDWCGTYRPTRLAPGTRTTFLHATRTAPFRAAWRQGFTDGRNGALANIEFHLAARREGKHWAKDVPLVAAEVVDWVREKVKGSAT